MKLLRNKKDEQLSKRILRDRTKLKKTERFEAGNFIAQALIVENGFDYKETYSPVAKYNSIRMILSLAAKRKMILEQFDVTTVYLHAQLNEEVFMNQPKGYEDGSNKVCKLKQSIYELKQ